MKYISKTAKMLIILMMTGPIQKNRRQFYGDVVEEILLTLPVCSVKKINYIILNTVQQNIKI